MNKVSVVIPSRRKIENLKKCISALDKQTQKPLEIIVVENDDKPTYAKHLKKRLSFKKNFTPLRIVVEKKVGKALARNLGIDKAKGNIIAFLDDDTLPPNNWLENILKIFRDNPDVNVIIGTSNEQNKSIVIQAFTCQYDNFFLERKVNKKTGEVKCGSALNTRNFAVKKHSLTANNVRFDSRYDKYGFVEDTDFGKQLELAKAKMLYSKKIEVLHTERAEIFNLLKKKFANGQAMVLYKKKGIHNENGTERTVLRNLFVLFQILSRYSVKNRFLFLIYFVPIVLAYKVGYLSKNAQLLVSKMKHLPL